MAKDESVSEINSGGSGEQGRFDNKERQDLWVRLILFETWLWSNEN